MRVKAIRPGFYGGALRQPGDTFAAAGKASWYEPVEDGLPAVPKKAAKTDAKADVKTDVKTDAKGDAKADVKTDAKVDAGIDPGSLV